MAFLLQRKEECKEERKWCRNVRYRNTRSRNARCENERCGNVLCRNFTLRKRPVQKCGAPNLTKALEVIKCTVVAKFCKKLCFIATKYQVCVVCQFTIDLGEFYGLLIALMRQSLLRRIRSVLSTLLAHKWKGSKVSHFCCWHRPWAVKCRNIVKHRFGENIPNAASWITVT